MPLFTPRRGFVATATTTLVAACLLGGAAPAIGQTRVGSGGFSGGSGGSGFSGGGSSGFSGGGSGFSGGSGGSGFSGGMGGGSFGGSSGNFSGSSYAPSQLTGTGNTGGFQGGFQGGTAGGVQASNPFGSYYANPYAAGVQGTSTRSAAFGTPIYNTSTTVSQSTTGLGTGNRGATGLSGSGGGILGTGRAPAYTAVISFSHPVAAPSQIQSEVEQVLARSSSLSGNRAIRVDLIGPAVVLRGMVADDHDRAIAEGLVRMTPGVREVRNELQTLAGLPPPALPE